MKFEDIARLKFKQKGDKKTMAKKYSRRKGKLTQEEFERVKTLKSYGMPDREVAKIIGCAKNSIPSWLRHKTWADYIAYKKDYAIRTLKHKTPAEPHKIPSVKTQVQKDNTGLVVKKLTQALAKQNSLLAELVRLWS